MEEADAQVNERYLSLPFEYTVGTNSPLTHSSGEVHRPTEKNRNKELGLKVVISLGLNNSSSLS